MKEPTYVLSPSTKVQIHTTTDKNSGKKPGAFGYIKGLVPGCGGDVYFVTHDEKTIAQYGWWEFEIAEAVPLADKLASGYYVSKVAANRPKKRGIDQGRLYEEFLNDLVAEHGMQDHPKGKLAAHWAFNHVASRNGGETFLSEVKDLYVSLFALIR